MTITKEETARLVALVEDWENWCAEDCAEVASRVAAMAAELEAYQAKHGPLIIGASPIKCLACNRRIEELAAANKREAELTASGKVLVESNTRFFREARDNWERAEAAESRLAELHGALEWCLREVKYVAFDQVALSFWCSDLELQRGNCFTSTRLAGSDGPSIAAALIASKGEGR